MLEALLGHDPALLARGTVEIGIPWPAWAAAVGGTAIAIAWASGLTGRGAPGGRRRAALAALRTIALAGLLFALVRPELVVEAPSSGRARVVVLLDGSRSMGLADGGGATRAERAWAAFAPGTGTVARTLAARFDVETLRVGLDVEPVDPGVGPVADAPAADLAGALEAARTALAGAPGAGVILVGDGVRTPGPRLDRAALALRAEGVALHAVGVGAERFARDLELDDVQVPGAVLAGDTVEARVSLEHRGLAGEPVRVVAEDDGAIAAEAETVLAGEGRPSVVRLALRLDEPGVRTLTFRAAPREGERVLGNETATRLVRVREEPLRVLHFEGEPRFEVKFLRRAVAGDDAISLISLVRTAESKYYLLGEDPPPGLERGFPATPEALFGFDVVVLGSAPAAEFSAGQLGLLTDLVERRGAGLLLLGGRRAFAEGGYAATRLARAMPVVLGPRREGYRRAVAVAPTRAALEHPLARVPAGSQPGIAWSRLPPLTAVNPVRAVKPGARVLLVGRTDRAGAADPPQIVLAYQRYGRGLVAAMPVRDTWRWQMNAAVPRDDPSHELLWRRLLRWLGRGVPGRVTVAPAPRRAVPGQSVEVAVTARDAAYRPLAAARLRLEVTSPLGERLDLALARRPGVPGAYRTAFVPREAGRHDLRVVLREDGGGEAIAAAETALVVEAAGREAWDAELDAAGLRALAERTGGTYLPIDRAAELADRLRAPAGGTAEPRRLPLWDAPILYLLVAAALALEWVLRRRWGLA